MITSCAGCRRQIRDCTGWLRQGFGSTPVLSWYHTGTGSERCESGGTIASPARLVSTACPVHTGQLAGTCHMCLTSAEVSLHFHNTGRCIPRFCRWIHES